MQEREILIHPEPLWGNNAGVLDQLTQHLQNVVWFVFSCHE